MKKAILILSLMLAFGAVSNAQVSVIPKVGATVSNIKFDKDLDNQASKTGLVVGAGFNFASSTYDFLSIQPEVLYVQQGYQQINNDDYIRYGLNYLQIPILVKASFGNDAVKAYVNAGPSFGYAIGGKESYSFDRNIFGFNFSGSGERKIKFGEGDDNSNTAYYDPDRFNAIDIAVQLGGGIGIAIGPGTAILDIRYGLGVNNFKKQQETTIAGITISRAAEGKSRTLALSVGYAIPLK